MGTKKIFGLLGATLAHSFSKKFFDQKFREMNLLQYEYRNFELASIAGFPEMNVNRWMNLTGWAAT